MNIAVLLTVYNRKEKTLRCLESLMESHRRASSEISFTIFLTDDGCTDGTAESIVKADFQMPIHILQGNGALFWNGGMIRSWKAALQDAQNYDGYLWLNDDVVVFPEFWNDLSIANNASIKTYGKKGIYVGSTRSAVSGEFSYGGFNFVNRWTLKDKFIKPDGNSFQPCQCAHGNITDVSHEVIASQGIK